MNGCKQNKMLETSSDKHSTDSAYRLPTHQLQAARSFPQPVGQEQQRAEQRAQFRNHSMLLIPVLVTCSTQPKQSNWQVFTSQSLVEAFIHHSDSVEKSRSLGQSPRRI